MELSQKWIFYERKQTLPIFKTVKMSTEPQFSCYWRIAALRFWSYVACFSRLWARESHPTSSVTFSMPRSRNRRKPRLFFSCPKTLSGSVIRRTAKAYPSLLCKMARACFWYRSRSRLTTTSRLPPAFVQRSFSGQPSQLKLRSNFRLNSGENGLIVEKRQRSPWSPDFHR